MTRTTASRSSPTATQFYPAMLDAIGGARNRSTSSATSSGTARSAESSSTRWPSGPGRASRVTLVLDAIGSFGTFRRIGATAARRRLPGRALPAITWYRLAPPEQPHPPRAARRRRRDRLRRRRRRRRLVGDAARRQADVARHDGADRRPDRRGDSGRRRGELAGVLRRNPDRARDLQAAQPGRATRRRSR